jgi:putative endonuclease
LGARHYYVYILTSRIGGTLYIGVTNDLVRRVFEHKSKLVEGFTESYDVVKLVYSSSSTIPKCHQAREAVEEVAACLENLADRETQS